MKRTAELCLLYLDELPGTTPRTLVVMPVRGSDTLRESLFTVAKLDDFSHSCLEQ